MAVCPCCGYDGKGSVNFSTVIAMARLSPLETAIFNVLARRMNEYVPLQEIVSEVYDMTRDAGPMWTKATIGVTTSRLKEKIERFGMTIGGRTGGANGCRAGRRLVWMISAEATADA